MKPTAAIRTIGRFRIIVVLRQLTALLLEYQFTDGASWQFLVVFVDDSVAKTGHRLTNGSDATFTVDENTWSIDHAEPLDDLDVEALLEFNPTVDRGTRRQDTTDRI